MISMLMFSPTTWIILKTTVWVGVGIMGVIFALTLSAVFIGLKTEDESEDDSTDSFRQ